MNPLRAGWEDGYATRGHLWGGQSDILPPLAPGSRVLELGCGNGRSIPGMLSREWRVCALDFSRQAILLSRELPGTEAQVTWIIGDGCALPFRDAVFDAVVASHIFGHLPAASRSDAANEACRVLRIGGRLIFRAFAFDDMRSGKGEEVEYNTYRRGDGIYTHYFSEDEVKSLFHRFSPLSIRTRRWTQRIRGVGHTRSVIEAEFLRI